MRKQFFLNPHCCVCAFSFFSLHNIEKRRVKVRMETELSALIIFHFRMVFMLVLCYVICWTPVWVFGLLCILPIRFPVFNVVLCVRIIDLLPCINCVLNPFIYIAYIVVDFRNHYPNTVKELI